jgi:branched-chain amino acid transport system substrate-binding protein
MKMILARHTAAVLACVGLGLAAPALAQDKTVKIGVLNDMSGLYSDVSGPNSVVAVKMPLRIPALSPRAGGSTC